MLQKVCDVHLNSCSDSGGAFGGFSSSVERNALAHNYQKERFTWGAKSSAHRSPQCFYSQGKVTFGYPEV